MEQSLEEMQALRAKALEKVAEKNRKIVKLQVSDPKSTKTPAVPSGIARWKSWESAQAVHHLR